MTQSPSLFQPIYRLMQASREPSLAVTVGLNDNDAYYVWADFQSHVEQLTSRLRGVPQQKWAICTQDSYWFAVAFMAACHAQKHIILPGNLQSGALLELSDHFEALLHDEVIDINAFAEPLLQSSISLPFSDAKQKTAYPFELLGDTPITLFTSGSSGAPKAIEKTLVLLDTELAQLEQTWGQELSGAIIASTVSHQHIYGLLFRVLWPLAAGRAFYPYDWQYPEQMQQHASPNTVLASSPALLKRVTKGEVKSNYRAIFSSGGPLAFDAARTCFEQYNQWPREVLGSTETGGISHRQQVSNTTPWQAFDAIKIELNAEGCLRILSPLVDSQSWYQTADQCELLNSQQFVLKGRADRVVKIEEKRISLTEIERRLNQLDEVAESAVIALQTEQRLITAAAITLTTDGLAKLTQLGKGKFWLYLRSELHQWIEPVGIPRRFKVVDEIPLNTQGKRLISNIETLFSVPTLTSAPSKDKQNEA
ncbi:AMP-binding protein [Vibrio algicola]|uniref:AMP-binding protein n=1 Tax=Vibrio algicola TaxID=2662262 RepID=A0A5Q0TIE9_9VIBR|nr:AMP-binding protein [Vibrio algicola]